MNIYPDWGSILHVLSLFFGIFSGSLTIGVSYQTKESVSNFFFVVTLWPPNFVVGHHHELIQREVTNLALDPLVVNEAVPSV